MGRSGQSGTGELSAVARVASPPLYNLPRGLPQNPTCHHCCLLFLLQAARTSALRLELQLSPTLSTVADVDVETEVATAGQPKKRTFRKYSYRGMDLDVLLDMSTDDLIQLFQDALPIGRVGLTSC
ncbi:hypothetical protein E2562_020667 [Oryza meyeriana var. granulata]|uniref:40S ribosomal protein S15 n=1 Tax=Oryza meyeriana var. granulata TaxID=110450 RepID=A0A6G1EDG8_9ORYZ|nr:hypothetical protein E2562_020667 [Oryza meyeriana var. granulata]